MRAALGVRQQLSKLTCSPTLMPLQAFRCCKLTSSPKPLIYLPQIPHKIITHLLNSLPKPSQISQFLAQVITNNQTVDHVFLMKLIETCVSSNGFTSSTLIFTCFHDLIDAHVFNLVLKTYTHLKKYGLSLFVYVQMHKHGICSDLLTFPVVIKSAAHLCRRKVGKSLHCCVIKMGFVSDLYANTALVHMYSFCLFVDDARRVFDEMPYRNSVSWNALVNGYVANRMFLEMFDVFRDMVRDGIELREVTMVGVLSACANLGALELGRRVHDYIRRNGLSLNVYVGSSLMDMYAKCGCLEKACEVFREMRVINVCAWNVLIAAYSMNGRVEDALTAFFRMTFDDYKPDDVTFLAVLSACSIGGLVDEGRAHFQSLKEVFGLEPKMEHYGCMVELLGRAGLLDEALDLIRTMPFVPAPMIWRALLRTSEFQENSYLAEFVLLKLVELEPKNGDNFLLLSNLYAQQHKWAEVDLLMEIMKDRGIQKIPGYTSIEINNVIFEFVATLEFEPGLEEEIYKVLKCMAEE